MNRFLCAALVAVFMAAPAWAGPEEDLFTTANIIYQSAENQPAELQELTYGSVRQILDQIVSTYPASDIAVRIMLQDTIEGLDVRALDTALEELEELAATETEVAALRETSPEPITKPSEAAIPNLVVVPDQNTVAVPQALQEIVQPPVASYSVSDEATEDALDLDRNGIRDLQARLLVSGNDPNGVDGAIGRGTRGAISAWQTSIGATPTGYMSAELLGALKAQTDEDLAVWLEESTNAKAYLPPPPIVLGPRNMSGRWRYTSRCGPNSKLPNQRLTGSLVIQHVRTNQYTGTLTNSQGLRARVAAILNGRTVNATANFGFLLGEVNTTARVDDQQLVLRGRDSNGCSFYASK